MELFSFADHIKPEIEKKAHRASLRGGAQEHIGSRSCRSTQRHCYSCNCKFKFAGAVRSFIYTHLMYTFYTTLLQHSGLKVIISHEQWRNLSFLSV